MYFKTTDRYIGLLYSQNTGTDLNKSHVQLDSLFLAVLKSIQSFEFQ